MLATQRAVIAALGGGAVRANMSEVLVGNVARATESRPASGAEKEIPDIREYAKGAPGYFQRWDPHSGQVTGLGRAFLLGKPPEELAYMKRLWRPAGTCGTGVFPTCRRWRWTAARPPPRTPPAPPRSRADMRGRLASITQAATQPPSPPAPPAPPVPAIQMPLGIPPADGGYVTTEALADLVHEDLVDVDDDTRAVLEQARQIRDKAARRPHLTVVPDPESDAS